MPKTKEDKQKEATARQTAHDALTVKEKIEKLESRGIKSGKEYNKLIEKLATANV